MTWRSTKVADHFVVEQVSSSVLSQTDPTVARSDVKTEKIPLSLLHRSFGENSDVWHRPRRERGDLATICNFSLFVCSPRPKPSTKLLAIDDFDLSR
jgi:hypothetical protein